MGIGRASRARCVHGLARGRAMAVALALGVSVTAGVPPAAAQPVDVRGFVEAAAALFPLTAPQDDRLILADLRARLEPRVTPTSWLRIAAGVDARIDSSRQVARTWRVDWFDRGRLRPAVAIRQLQASFVVGATTVDVGKQFIRWGKTDIVTPTDRFAPRDFITVVDDELLAVTGVRVTTGTPATTVEMAIVPRMTPSRLPLVDRRWSALPDAAARLPVVELPAMRPSRMQVGMRVNHIGRSFEAAVTVYDGVQHLPMVTVSVPAEGPDHIALQPRHTRLRMAGVDTAWPLPWFTLKSEAAYFRSPDGAADDYVLGVLQAERQFGEWSMVAGYAGEILLADRTDAEFSPDRGASRAFLGRLSYTLDANRNVALEAAVRQNVRGAWVETSYSQALGAHLRATVTAHLIGGDDEDFIGRYRRNSHVLGIVRWSF